jgi:hypothetical protein
MPQLAAMSDEELLAIRRFGVGSFAEVQRILGRERWSAATASNGGPARRRGLAGRPAALREVVLPEGPTAREAAGAAKARTGPASAAALLLREAVRKQLIQPEPNARGWQTRLAERFRVTRQRVHVMVLEERRRCDSDSGRSTASVITDRCSGDH